MKLNELLVLVSLDTCIVLRNTYTFMESDPKILYELIKLENFSNESKDYKVERIGVIKPDCLRIDIIYDRRK